MADGRLGPSLDLGALLVPRESTTAWDDLLAWESPVDYSSSGLSSLASTTDPSPATGPAEPSQRTLANLSTTLDADALAASLQQWAGATRSSSFARANGGSFDADMTTTETPTPRPRSVHGHDVGFVFPEAPPIHAYSHSLPPTINEVQHAHLLAEASNSSGSSPSSNEASTSRPRKKAALARKPSGKKGKGVAELDDDDADKPSTDIIEERRRKNSEASARFRSRKKERDQALASEKAQLNGKVSALEQEVERLRAENGWLRGLIVERGPQV